MKTIDNNQKREQLLKARESFSGRLLTDNQFNEAIAITNIMEREIHKSGIFKEKLGDYTNAFARTEKFDAIKAEGIVRDLFKERTGQTMNQMRKILLERESTLFVRDDSTPNKTIKPELSENVKDRAYQSATDVGQKIKEGNKITFYRAYSHQAIKLAKDLNITQAGAKRLMQEQFEEAENQTLYEWGKELEEKHYRPQIEAEQQAREESRTQKPAHTLSRS